ncbi:MAG: hypothetical protein ABIJ09_15590 [Pseudomonadota bacterium]
MRSFCLLTGLALMLSACGPEVGGRTELTLELAAFSSTDVLTVYVLSQDLKGGGKVSCSMLQASDPTFQDTSRIDILAKDSANANQLESGAVTLELIDIPAGPDRIFGAEVVDLNTSARRGFGCTPGVTIEANKAVQVNLSVTEI